MSNTASTPSAKTCASWFSSRLPSTVMRQRDRNHSDDFDNRKGESVGTGVDDVEGWGPCASPSCRCDPLASENPDESDGNKGQGQGPTLPHHPPPVPTGEQRRFRVVARFGWQSLFRMRCDVARDSLDLAAKGHQAFLNQAAFVDVEYRAVPLVFRAGEGIAHHHQIGYIGAYSLEASVGEHLAQRVSEQAD